MIRIQVNREKYPKFIDFSTNVLRSLCLLNSLRKHENILIISTISRQRGFKHVNDLIEQSNGHTVLHEKNTQSMKRCLHRVAPPEKHYIAEPSVQLADLNTQTVKCQKYPWTCLWSLLWTYLMLEIRCLIHNRYKALWCRIRLHVLRRVSTRARNPPNISRIICADWIYQWYHYCNLHIWRCGPSTARIQVFHILPQCIIWIF